MNCYSYLEFSSNFPVRFSLQFFKIEHSLYVLLPLESRGLILNPPSAPVNHTRNIYNVFTIMTE